MALKELIYIFYEYISVIIAFSVSVWIEAGQTEDSLQHDLQPGLVHLHVHDDTLGLHHWNQPNTEYELTQDC